MPGNQTAPTAAQTFQSLGAAIRRASDRQGDPRNYFIPERTPTRLPQLDLQIRSRTVIQSLD
jgi:hypothetical protein